MLRFENPKKMLKPIPQHKSCARFIFIGNFLYIQNLSNQKL